MKLNTLIRFNHRENLIIIDMINILKKTKKKNKSHLLYTISNNKFIVYHYKEKTKERKNFKIPN